MVGAENDTDTYQQRRTQRPGAIAVKQRLRHRRITPAGRRNEAIGEGRSGVAPDQDETPGAQPSMIGRPQAEIEDQLEIAPCRGRILESADRATTKQEIESVPTVFEIRYSAFWSETRR